jgi:phage terminase large subunit
LAAGPRVIPYAPRRVFVPFHMRDKRWAVLVAHRRCGKTVACINDLIARALALTQPHGRLAYVAPFLAQAKEVAWEYLKRYSLPALRDKNESELWVELLNGSRIRIHGADNPDRLRGAYLDGVVLDEYADMRPSVWGEVIRPMLADRRGWATFIGTPKGRNEFWQLYDGATNGWPQPNGERIPADDWLSVRLLASETGLLDSTELEDAKRTMTPEQYEQEFECSFEAAILGAYYGKEIAEAERAGRITDVPYEPALPVQTAWDLGHRDSTAIWFFQTLGSEIRVIDFYENHGQGLPHYAGVLAAKPYRYSDDWVPHDAKVHELGTGKTRVETLIALGRNPKLVADHEVIDGINAARMTLPVCWFDKYRCADGIEALRQYRTEFDEKVRAFKKTPRHDWTSHTADAFRYLAIRYREFAKPEPKPEKPKSVIYEVKPDGSVQANVSVREAVEILRRRKARLRDE